MSVPEPIPDLLKAVNEASGKAFALWITFLTVGTYLAISIGTTTHMQLLLDGPVKLPLLGVDMPLFAFYGFAPPLFVVLHLYVLMQLYLLARLLRLFGDDLRAADMIEQDRRRVSRSARQVRVHAIPDWRSWRRDRAVVPPHGGVAELRCWPGSATARVSAAVPALSQHSGHLRASGGVAARPRNAAAVVAQDIPEQCATGKTGA
jgi:hypothetical protein